ncbi:MAG TPA: mannitol dehydrogenase family protein [Mycobacteriales bacterium]|nr:mannitol dehydrogenase family protein [Mycobacteriales bacterium]
MTAQGSPGPLSRAAGDGRPAAPVALVHLGLGNFFRAHQAWYTERAPDAAAWGYGAFVGRGTGLADAMTPQDGLYTLITRAADGDRFEVIGSVSRAHAFDDAEAWAGYFASAGVRAVSITVTEAGYRRGPDGGLDRDDAGVRTDVEALRAGSPGGVRSAPGRLVAGLAARRRADAGPVTLVPCDNLPGNGAVAARVVHDLAEAVDPQLAAWIEESVSTVTTMVDRITPRTTPDDARAVEEATGRADQAPVATEPFSEWVLSGEFPAGRPRWEAAGARFTDDILPFEHRKLWLLNGGHSLLAYAGSLRGHATVAEAVSDDTCRSWLEQWWAEASPHVDLPADDVAAYRAALLERFANPRIRHQLDQIATDGSQKLPVRILPALRRERARGHLPDGAVRVLAAWLCTLRGRGAPVTDARADEIVPLADGPLAEAACRVLECLDPDLAGDRELVLAVTATAAELTGP